MSLAQRLQRLIPELHSAVANGAGHRQLRQQMLSAIRRHIAFDGACAATLDPVTVMWTDCEVADGRRDPKFEERVFAAEYQSADVAPMAEIARRSLPVSVLSEETGGDLARSVRYREAYAPAGIGDELRLVLVDGQVPWGSLQLARCAEGRHFSRAQGEALATVSAPLARLLRYALLREAIDIAGDDRVSPGLLLMQEGRVVEASPAVPLLLGGPVPECLPAGVHGVVARAKLGESSSARCPGPNAGWLVLHGTPLGNRVAILIERATPLALASVVTCGFGLSDREGQVLASLVRGHSTKQLARELEISDWTVQDHLKSLFRKVGVSTRQELVAAVFFGYWAPEHRNRSQPSVHGHFQRSPRSPS